MKKAIIGAVILGVGAIMSGCKERVGPMETGVLGRNIVQMSGHIDGEKRIGYMVEAPSYVGAQVSCVRVGDVPKVEMVLQSKEKKTIKVEYRITWFDGNGQEIRNVSDAWRLKLLRPYQAENVHAVPPSVNAASFRCYVRRIE